MPNANERGTPLQTKCRNGYGLQVTCFRSLREEEMEEPEDGETDHDAGEDGAGGARRQRRPKRGRGAPRPKVPLNFTIEALSAEGGADEGAAGRLVVGTSDGRMLLLKVAFEKGKAACRQVHDVPVVHGPDAQQVLRGVEGVVGGVACGGFTVWRAGAGTRCRGGRQGQDRGGREQQVRGQPQPV